MKLWYLALGINRDEGIHPSRAGLPEHPMYDGMFISHFAYETRSVCNYLMREVRKLRFETEGFNQISIKLSQQPEVELLLDTSRNIRSYVLFDYDQYMALPKERDTLNEFFIALISSGLDKVRSEHSIPYEAYLSAIDAFRSAGYVNEWVLKSRSFRDPEIKCTLFASFDVKRVTFTLIIERKKNEIYREEILRVKPDEVHFRKEIKDIKIIEGNLVLTEPIADRQVWSKPLKEIICSF